MGMTRTKDGRPRDWGYIATVPAEELPEYQRMASEIQQTHNIALIEDFNKACENHDPRFISVTKAEDLVVTVGLQQCLNVVLGNASTLFRYMSVGTGSLAPAIGDSSMTSEASGGRIDMASAGRGWREAQGMKMFYGAIGNEQAPSATYTEMGVYTASSGGILLNHEVFANLGIGHVSPNRASIFSCVIEFCPVV